MAACGCRPAMSSDLLPSRIMVSRPVPETNRTPQIAPLRSGGRANEAGLLQTSTDELSCNNEWSSSFGGLPVARRFARYGAGSMYPSCLLVGWDIVVIDTATSPAFVLPFLTVVRCGPNSNKAS